MVKNAALSGIFDHRQDPRNLLQAYISAIAVVLKETP
jgi:hypothetical protein